MTNPFIGDDRRNPFSGNEMRKPGPSDRERAARKRAREATNEAERKALNTASASFVNFLDAGTFGVAGLATDALSPGSFRANRDARQAIYNSMPLKERLALGIAGGIANPMKVPGLGQGGSLFKVAGRGVVQGGAQGGAQGYGENVGTTSGALLPTAVGAAGGAVAGGLLAPIAAKLASRLFPIDPAQAAAAARAATAVDADKAIGYEVPVLPTGRGMPDPMAIDEVGPTMLAQARGATGTVPGREAFRAPFEAREKSMPRLLTGDVPDAVRMGEQMRTARKVQADADYGAAIEATKGQPIETPMLDALLETPTGRAAWKAVQMDRPDLVLGVGDANRALPRVPVAPPGRGSLLQGYEPTVAQPEPPVTERVVPDAEAIHELTRHLTQWAKGEKGQVFPDGVSAKAAGNALMLLERAKDELPLPFRIANENYRAASVEIDALEMGRTPWRVNPKPGKRSLPMAVVERQVAAMPPDVADLVRAGKRFDVAARVNEGTLTPAKAVEKMDRPSGSLAREMRVAGGPLPGRLRAWDAVFKRQGEVLPASGPRLEPPAGGLLGRMAETAGPTKERTIVNAVRSMFGRSAEKALIRRGMEDAEFAKLLTGKPGDVEKAIAYLAKRDKGMAFAARAAAKSGGNVSARSGLLDNY